MITPHLVIFLSCIILE